MSHLSIELDEGRMPSELQELQSWVKELGTVCFDIEENICIHTIRTEIVECRSLIQ